MISGDNPVTVSQVARQAGIPGAERYVDARELTTPEAITQAAQDCIVFGRVTPERKRALVQAMKAAGQWICVTSANLTKMHKLKLL